MTNALRTCSLFWFDSFWTWPRIEKVKQQLDAGVSLYGLKDELPEPLNGRLSELGDWWKKSDEVMYRLSVQGLKFLTPLDAAYPQGLNNLDLRPPLLTVRGQLQQKFHLTVVGSRNLSTDRSNFLSDLLQNFLSLQDVVVVSGGARGVDQLAHRSALRAQRSTQVWLPSGYECYYPRELAAWEEMILQSGGSIVSPFAPWTEMKKGYFHSRNACVAAVSDAVLIGACRRRSGTRVTADWARNLGKPLAAVPGSPWDSHALGANDMILDGATAIQSERDLHEFVRSSVQGLLIGVGRNSAGGDIRKPDAQPNGERS